MMSLRTILVGIVLFASQSAASSEGHEGRDALADLATKIREHGGYVHPALHIVSPAPSGADRGVIFAKDAGPSIVNEDAETSSNVWLRVPFSYQLTRNLALDTLTPLIPKHVLDEAPLVTLDDAALLVLLLVHLRGNSAQNDEWYPYLATLPDDPGCGWWSDDNPYEKIIPNDVIASARDYVGRVSSGMAQDYGSYLASEHWPKEWSVTGAALAIKWSLCVISSRGTAASPTLGGGSVRLVPFADMFNHNSSADGFIELSDEDVGSKEESKGAFEVRKREGTRPGDEVTVDYNLVGYYPEDWFLSHGFIPTEVLGAHSRTTSEL